MLDKIVRDLKYIRRYYGNFRLLHHFTVHHFTGKHINAAHYQCTLTIRRHTIVIHQNSFIMLETTYKRQWYKDMKLLDLLGICLKCKDRKALVW